MKQLKDHVNKKKHQIMKRSAAHRFFAVIYSLAMLISICGSTLWGQISSSSASQQVTIVVKPICKIFVSDNPSKKKPLLIYNGKEE